MANRTLRLSRSTTSVNPGADIPVPIDDSGRISPDHTGVASGIENADRELDVDGEHDESESSSSVGVGYREIDPGELDSYIDANAGTADSAGSAESGKRRGRKPGSKNRTGAGAKKAAKTLEPFIVMVHIMMATTLKIPELNMSPEEAKQLADAYAVFCEYHNVPVLSGKRLSEIQMLSTIFTVYGTRLTAFRMRVKEEKVQRARNVTPFPHGNVG